MATTQKKTSSNDKTTSDDIVTGGPSLAAEVTTISDALDRYMKRKAALEQALTEGRPLTPEQAEDVRGAFEGQGRLRQEVRALERKITALLGFADDDFVPYGVDDDPVAYQDLCRRVGQMVADAVISEEWAAVILGREKVDVNQLSTLCDVYADEGVRFCGTTVACFTGYGDYDLNAAEYLAGVIGTYSDEYDLTG